MRQPWLCNNVVTWNSISNFHFQSSASEHSCLEISSQQSYSTCNREGFASEHASAEPLMGLHSPKAFVRAYSQFFHTWPFLPMWQLYRCRLASPGQPSQKGGRLRGASKSGVTSFWNLTQPLSSNPVPYSQDTRFSPHKRSEDYTRTQPEAQRYQEQLSSQCTITNVFHPILLNPLFGVWAMQKIIPSLNKNVPSQQLKETQSCAWLWSNCFYWTDKSRTQPATFKGHANWISATFFRNTQKRHTKFVFLKNCICELY